MARDMLKQLKAPEHAAPEPSAGGGSNSYSNNNNNSSNGGGGGGGGAVPLIKAIEFFDTVQIFPGSKTVHLEKIRGATGVRYEEMLFFDDESRNRDTERLGVVMWLVREGLSNDEVDMGVLSWRKRNRRQLE
jgi:magnesium-dependent phosphatase 1